MLLGAATATDSTNFTFRGGSSQSTRNLGSTVEAEGNLTVTASGDIALAGSTAAGKAATVDAGGDVLITSVQDSESYRAAVSSKSNGLFGGGKRGFSESSSSTTTIGSAITGGTDVTVTAHNGDLAVQAARIAAREALRLTATQGGVQILTARDSTFHSEDHSSTGMVWQSQNGSGKVDETTRYAVLTAGDGIAIIAAKGVTAEIHTGGASLADTVAALAQHPETAWIAQVAKRDDVTWKRVQEIHDNWDYESQDLSGPAAMGGGAPSPARAELWPAPPLPRSSPRPPSASSTTRATQAPSSRTSDPLTP